MENEKDIINQTANFVRSYHSKFSNGLVTPDKEGLKMLAGVYDIAQKYRLQAQKNYYKDEYGAACWHNDFEFYRNVNFILAWCDKFSFLIPRAGRDAVALAQEQATAVESEQVPQELQSEQARIYFSRAIDAGLMEETARGYRWLKTNVLLAYFAEEMAKRFGIYKKWKTFERLFNKENLSNSKQTWLKENGYKDYEPIGYEKVKSIFD